MATFAALQQDLEAPAVLLAAEQLVALAWAQQADFAEVHCSPACNEVSVAKAAKVKQARIFCIMMLLVYKAYAGRL